MSKKFSLICLGILALIISSSCEVFLEHGIDNETKILYNYFSSESFGFYVDIGSYDPTFASNTLGLYANGWDGVNIDANYERLNRFNMLRSDQTNLNYAIGEADKFVTLYEMEDDSTSTVSTTLVNSMKDKKSIVKEILVPSLSLKQICERYFFRRPIFMNIDAEGMEAKILEGNNWENKQCVPDIIVAELNDQHKIVGSAESVLTKHGYRKVSGLNMGANELYILESVVPKYEAKAELAKKASSKFKIASFTGLISELAKALNIKVTLKKHYEPQTDEFYYKFTRPNEHAELEKLNEESNLLSTKQNRPLIIFNLNPQFSAILIERSEFTTKTIKVQEYNFLEVKVTKSNGEVFSAYIFDHEYDASRKLEDKIIRVDKSAKTIEEGKTLSESDSINLEEELSLTAEIKSILQELRNEKELISKLKESYKIHETELRNSFTNVSKAELNTLSSIQNKLSVISEKLSFQESGAKLTETNIETDINNISTLQMFTMITTIVMSMFLCCVVCRSWSNNKAERKRTSRIPQSANSMSINHN